MKTKSHVCKYHATSNVFRCNCGKIVKKENSKCDWDTEALSPELRIGVIEFKNGSSIASVWRNTNTISGTTTTAKYITEYRDELNHDAQRLQNGIVNGFIKKMFFVAMFMMGLVFVLYGLSLIF
jgi:hypothetical protein